MLVSILTGLVALGVPSDGVAANDLASVGETDSCAAGPEAVDHARDLRQALSLEVDEATLEATFADSTYSCSKYGIPLSPKEEAEFDAVVTAQSELSDLAESVSSSPDFAGAYLTGPTLTVRTTTGDLQKSLDDQLNKISATASIMILPAEYTQKDLNGVSAAIAAKISSYSEAGIQISLVAVDPQTNRVTVGVASDVPTADKELRSEFGGMVDVVARQSADGDELACIEDDCGTKGGLTIQNVGIGCTSGFLVQAQEQNNPGWQHFILTAGHCIYNSSPGSYSHKWHNGALTTTWGFSRASDFWQTPQQVGWTLHNDLGLIKMGGVLPPSWNNYYIGAGVSEEVIGATQRDNQLVGQTICFTGSASGDVCGELTSKNDVMCLTGCTQWLYNAVEIHARANPGDSGAGIYRPYTTGDHDYAYAYGVMSIGGGILGYSYYWPAYGDLYAAGPGQMDRDLFLVRPCTSPTCPLN